ncbi:MAG: MATE family efflux transporter [Lachnospiraceae bacterium]|nr:MATE family efflux transporter [Lachnospiraceae bacterium]
MNDRLSKELFMSNFYVTFLGMLVASLGMLADGIIIFRFFGSNAMGAYGVVMPLTIAAAAVGSILTSGIQSTTGKSMIRGDSDATNGYFSLAVLIGLITSALMIVIVLGFSTQVLNVLRLRQDNPMFADALDYMRGSVISYLFIIMISAYQPVLMLLGKRIVVFAAVLVMLFVNVAGDLLSVFLHLGMFGIGLATTLSYMAGFLIMMVWLLKEGPLFRFSFRNVNGKAGELLLFGMPSGVQKIANALRIAVLNALLLAISTKAAVSALSVTFNISNIIGNVVVAGGSTVLMLASIYIGDEDEISLKKTFNIAVWEMILINGVIAIFVFLLAKPIVGIYCTDAEQIPLTATSLRWFVTSMPLFGVNIVWIRFLQASGKLALSTILNVCDNFIYVVLAALVLSKPFGDTGVWASFLVCEVMMTITLFICCFKNAGKASLHTEDLIMLPHVDEAERGERLDQTITKPQDAVDFSEKVYALGMKMGLSTRTTMLMSLCVEELTCYTIEKGFGDGKKHSIDARVLIKDHTWTISLRDDCKPMNPQDQLQIFKPEEAPDNMGLQIVYGCINDISYNNTMKMNHLVLSLTFDDSAG